MNVAYVRNMTDEKSLVKAKEGEERRNPGRPAKNVVDDETKEKLIANALGGLARVTNYTICGLSSELFNRTLKNKEFNRTFTGAEQAFLATVQKKLIDSALSNVENAKWLLERRMVDEFGNKQKLSVS